MKVAVHIVGSLLLSIPMLFALSALLDVRFATAAGGVEQRQLGGNLNAAAAARGFAWARLALAPTCNPADLYFDSRCRA